MARYKGMVITARGPERPSVLGKVMMHEHIHLDCYDSQRKKVIEEEKPITEERYQYLIAEAVPYLAECSDYECHALVDATPPPFRAWPTFYKEISEMTKLHIILSTGFYRQIEVGTFWVKTFEDSIWRYAVEATEQELAEFCIREIVDGIHGTDVHAGTIKLSASQKEMTATEKKAFMAGANAQKATGVSITTHCTQLGAETTQLRLLDSLGVNLNRVIIGHTARHLMDRDCRKTCIDWMKKGAFFLPTNLDVRGDYKRWLPLVEAIHDIFDAGLGDKILLGMDWSFCSGTGQSPDGRFGYCTYLPKPPFVYLFARALPRFRKLGLTSSEEEHLLVENPQKILPVL
jgi:phosphotriesterase-related protein